MLLTVVWPRTPEPRLFRSNNYWCINSITKNIACNTYFNRLVLLTNIRVEWASFNFSRFLIRELDEYLDALCSVFYASCVLLFIFPSFCSRTNGPAPCRSGPREGKVEHGSSLNFRNQLCRGVQFNTVCRAFFFLNAISFPPVILLVFFLFIVVMILNSK